MKEEVEFKWIVNLLNSPFVKGVFNNNGGCKKDFERYAGASENNSKFSTWFNQMNDCNAIQYSGFKKSSHGRNIESYVIIFKELNEILIGNSLYRPLMKIMDKKYLLRVAK